MIRLQKDNGQWVVTIDRQDKANSLTEAMLTQIAEAAEAAATEGARVNVIGDTDNRHE